MKEPDLYKFFSRNSSEEDISYLRAWLDISPDHQKRFLEERKLYNISILNAKQKMPEAEGKRTKKPISFKSLSLQLAKVAAIFLLALLCFHWLYNNGMIEAPIEETAYQSISVPFGQRIHLDLPDGSGVWLNAGTTIKYPVSFNKKIREVIIDGEAYFEIERNEKTPFRVLAGNHTIEVLGTKFNVQVDKINNTFETALFEGSVKIFDSSYPDKSVNLDPNTYVSLVDGALQMQLLSSFGRFNWRDGILCFEKEHFEDIMKTFEKSYGCKIIVVNKKVNKYLYTGKFLQTDGVDFALNLLRKSVDFTYTRNNETNTIVIN